MGKRKERRLAAMMAASRRVKLDLFAEPSGDFSDLSAHAEVGGDNESKSHPGLPNSPSSSGQQPENPLLLLGQYSDDEVDEESGGGLHNAVMENTSVDLDDQASVRSHRELEDTEITASGNFGAEKVEQQEADDCSALLDGTREINATDSTDLCIEIESGEQVSAPAASDTQVAGDVSSGWKIVLHEESNQYYYWNTLTGETSWEVPAVLAQGSELAGEQEASANVEVGEKTHVMHTSSITSDVEVDGAIVTQPSNGSVGANPNFGAKEICKLRPEMESWNEEYKGYSYIVPETTGGRDANQVDVVSSPHHRSIADYVPSRLSSGAQLDGQGAFGTVLEKCMHDIKDHGKCESVSEILSDLVKHGEYLLQRLKSLKLSEAHMEQDAWASKHILEVEIRLSDIKSLALHGSSLLPFWKHSARQLKKVEAAIKDEIDTAYKPQERISNIVKVDADNKKVFSVSEDSQGSGHTSLLTDMQKDSKSVAYNDDDVMDNDTSSFGYLTMQSGNDAVRKVDVDGTAVPAELTSKTVHHPGEDIDMDVDMEVEETIPASHTTVEHASDVQHHAPPEQSIEPILPEELKSIEQEEGFGVPPPPNEEWIPPPPPDDEPFPPPPPDEPPEPSYPQPPSDLEVAEPFSYIQQYNLSYPVSNIEYYAQTSTEVPGSGFYGEVAHPPLCYEAVPNTYPADVPAVINTIETAAYYGLQNGTVPPLPLVDGVDSSLFFNESGHRSTGSDETASMEPLAEAGCTLLPNTNVDVYGGEKTESASVEISFAPTSLQDSSTISVTENVSTSASLASTTTVITATATAPKVQSKVSRNKKRTVSVVSTLRSNKKVSSLVDKWKAAKEELHEDEDDTPENAYEILEKKRQREIEEWRAQQIASGEAKENANFQPLGGDWRERVKRKRALLVNKARQPPAVGASYGNQQPDLNEFSRDLPSGWQAYWDESSKQVYYGNAVTSQTTWIRPPN